MKEKRNSHPDIESSRNTTEMKKHVSDGHKARQRVFESNLVQWASQQRPDTQTHMGGGWQMSSPNKQNDATHLGS